MKKLYYKISIVAFFFTIYGCSPAENKAPEINTQANDVVTETLVDSKDVPETADYVQENIQMEKEISILSEEVDSLLQDI